MTSATQKRRIKRRREELRYGHSVKCWKYFNDSFSKYDRICTCDRNNEAPKPKRRVKVKADK